MSHERGQVREPADDRAAAARATVPTWRRLALGLLLVGCVGIILELMFLEHYEDPWQWAPIALLGLGTVAGSTALLRPGRTAVRVLQVLMSSYLLAAGLGVYFHLRANLEFERELNPAVGGSELVVEVLKGAMPALAPGAMAQLGLLGLLACFRHPSLTGHDPEQDNRS